MSQANNTITTYEHTSLSFKSQGLNDSHFRAMVRYNDLHGGKYFRVGLDKVTFNSYVGVIQCGNKVIEILPKADKEADTVANKDKWQKALLHMLKKAGYIKLNETEKASQHTRHTNLLDIYLYTYLKEVESLLHAGLVKKYRRERSNQSALKGRLLIEKQIQHNTIHKERFFTEHSVYDRDNIFNRILKTALEIVRDSTTNSSIKQEASKQLIYFDNISSWNGIAADFKKLKTDRKTKAYEYALELAKMIILNYSPDMKAGKQPVIALLFDMNVVFEKFIYRTLKTTELDHKDLKLSITGQNSMAFWGSKTIRPDIIIDFIDPQKPPVKQRVILDTKWKIVETGYPSDNDLKQMFTYNMQFGSDHSILLYPFIGQSNNGASAYAESARKLKLPHSCEMYFIDLFVKGGANISRTIGTEFIKYLLTMSTCLSREA